MQIRGIPGKLIEFNLEDMTEKISENVILWFTCFATAVLYQPF